MTDLILPLKREYFEAIRDGSKTEEYRLCNAYWGKRLHGMTPDGKTLFVRTFDRIVLMHGYPARDNHARRLVLPWRGYTVKTITHPHFGPDPVEVYAIKVARHD